MRIFFLAILLFVPILVIAQSGKFKLEGKIGNLLILTLNCYRGDTPFRKLLIAIAPGSDRKPEKCYLPW